MNTKLFELKPCPQCKGTGDAHHQGHDYDCGDCLGTGYEEPQGRIINLELMLNEHKMALKLSDAHNNELAQKLEIAWEQRDEALEYADKLAQGLPDGMLPKDIEVLREANCGLAMELTAVTEQRDELLQYNEAFRKETLICADCDAIRKEEYDQAIEQRDRLQRWKDEQLAIEIKWNPQAVGRLLGMTVGDEIREGIEPAIRSLIEQRDRLAQALRWIVVVYATEAEYKQVAQKALAAVKGGSDGLQG